MYLPVVATDFFVIIDISITNSVGIATNTTSIYVMILWQAVLYTSVFGDISVSKFYVWIYRLKSKAMKRCLELEIGLPYVNFKSIGDYIVLMCYYLKILGVTKTEIKAFIRDFEKITDEYRNAVNTSVANIVIRPDLGARMTILKNFI